MPDLVLDAVAAAGLAPDGRLLTLNSYENRVYQVGLDDGPMVVAKFYRPERWTEAQIDEEHAYLLTGDYTGIDPWTCREAAIIKSVAAEKQPG